MEEPQLALLNLAQENYAGIASSEVLVRPIRNLTLSRLSDLILNHDEVDAIGVNIIQMEPAGEHFPYQVRAIGGFLRPFLPPSLEPFGGAVACKGNGSNFEMNVVFVVHGYFEDENIRALDVSVHYLTVQVIDVRYPKISGEILTVGKPHIAPDAPLALLDGDDWISFDDREPPPGAGCEQNAREHYPANCRCC